MSALSIGTVLSDDGLREFKITGQDGRRYILAPVEFGGPVEALTPRQIAKRFNVKIPAAKDGGLDAWAEDNAPRYPDEDDALSAVGVRHAEASVRASGWSGFAAQHAAESERFEAEMRAHGREDD